MDGRSVVRELRSQAPLSLVPQRGTAARTGPLTVHLVGSAATPLGGDDVGLEVLVGPGAEVALTGVAAAVALAGGSRLDVRFEIADGAALTHRPEPTVVTRRADHATTLHATLGDGARLRLREVLVAGRTGEEPGRYRGSTRVDGPAGPLYVQVQDLRRLAGRRVLATEVLVWGADPDEAVAGEWWSLTPLARGGSLATALGPDAVSTGRDLDRALAAHPGLMPAPTGVPAPSTALA